MSSECNFIVMEKENDEVKFTVEGNPGQGNTFIHIGTAYNVNPAAKTVENTFNIYSSEEGEKAKTEAMGSTNPEGKKLSNMTYRQMLKDDLIDTGNMQRDIVNYVSCILTFVKKDMEKIYLRLWARIIEHEAFAVDLYDPGKQKCKFNRNLIGNIIHYLDSKKFYRVDYNQSEFAFALEHNKNSPVRGALRFDPDLKYMEVVDAILEELKNEEY